MAFKKRTIDNKLHLEASHKAFERARELRKNQTEAERLLWSKIRNRQLWGCKFRRQHPIRQFIADFYCHDKGLIIEIDGDIHDIEENKEYDQSRTDELERYGLKIIRFKNEEIFDNMDDVLKKIKEVMSEI